MPGGIASQTFTVPEGVATLSGALVQIDPDSTVTISITFSATYGKITTVYTAGSPEGTFTASNSCPDGAPSLSTSVTGLRAVVSGTS